VDGISSGAIPTNDQEGQVAVGDLTKADKKRIDAAVADAERLTGIEMCVILGAKAHIDPRTEAERAFHKAGLHERPSVLIVVTPSARTLEIVVAHDLRDRVTDQMCDETVHLMTGLFALGNLAGGLEQGIRHLAERASSPRPHEPSSEDLPNVIDLDD
jgi:uncharacterized membrane protein YgcG